MFSYDDITAAENQLRRALPGITVNRHSVEDGEVEIEGYLDDGTAFNASWANQTQELFTEADGKSSRVNVATQSLSTLVDIFAREIRQLTSVSQPEALEIESAGALKAGQEGIFIPFAGLPDSVVAFLRTLGSSQIVSGS